MQPHQFSYCSCLHLSKTRAKLYTSDSWGTVELKASELGRAAKACPHPNQTHPFTSWAFLQHCWVWLWRCKPLGWDALPPLPPRQNLAFLRSAHLWSAAGDGCPRQPAPGSPPTPGNTEPNGRNFPNPRTQVLQERELLRLAARPPSGRGGVCGTQRRRGAAGGERRGGGGAPRQRSDAVQTLGTKWPHCTPTAEPGLLAKWRTEGWEWSPQVASRARGAWAGAPGTAPLSRILTTRRGRAAQPQCQQRPQRSGAQGGHLLGRLLRRRRRLGRSTWGGGPDRGAPTFSSPPPTSAAHGLARRPEAQTSVSPLPAPQVRRSWAAATAAARSLAETFSGVQRSSLVCPSASAASSHRKPRPAVAAARPRRLRHPGVSRRKKRRPGLRAEWSTMSPQTPPSLANPRRVRTRLNSLGAGASLRAGPLPGVVLRLWTWITRVVNFPGETDIVQRDGYRLHTTTHPHTLRLAEGMQQRRTGAVKEGCGSHGAKVHLKWTEPSNGLCCTLHSVSQSFI